MILSMLSVSSAICSKVPVDLIDILGISGSQSGLILMGFAEMGLLGHGQWFCSIGWSSNDFGDDP